VECSTLELIDEAFLDYFWNIFTTSNPHGLDECFVGFPSKVIESMNN
jgi:hypothetical protein